MLAVSEGGRMDGRAIRAEVMVIDPDDERADGRVVVVVGPVSGRAETLVELVDGTAMVVELAGGTVMAVELAGGAEMVVELAGGGMTAMSADP